MHREQSIRIQTGARLHFGLLDNAPPFGGLGVMIEQPATVVEITAADHCTVDRLLERRVLPIAQRLTRMIGHATLPAACIRVRKSAPSHCGYGSGTQLSLAIAEGLCRFVDRRFDEQTLATQIADRGKRSAVGVHGYFHGGLIFESADDRNAALNPIAKRVELPGDWCLLLLRPKAESPVVCGDEERQAFSSLRSDPIATEQLRNAITGDILPAAEAGDFQRFSRAIGRYNHDSGMLFAEAQGGPYNGPIVTDLVQGLKARGALGVGQSSWGPGVFAWCKDNTAALALAASFQSAPVQTDVARVRNLGRCVAIE